MPDCQMALILPLQAKVESFLEMQLNIILTCIFQKVQDRVPLASRITCKHSAENLIIQNGKNIHSEFRMCNLKKDVKIKGYDYLIGFLNRSI